LVHSFPEFLPIALAAFSDKEFDAAMDLDRFLKSLGEDPDRVCTLDQVHGSRVVVAREPVQKMEADALVTNTKRLVLTVRTADCASVFFLDQKNRAVGICHAGWRGTKERIVQKTIVSLWENFHARAQDLTTAIGPVICANCYEVGAEFEAYFPVGLIWKAGKFFFDLKQEIKRQLVEMGVLINSIADAGVCTACSTDLYFSARREGQGTGRLISAIILK
jgi:YfiH family protein